MFARWPHTAACLLWLSLTFTLLLTSSVAAGQALDAIFPQDIGYGYNNYRAKRLFSDTSSSDCHDCLNTYDYDSCQRCWNTKPSFIPFHAKRSSSSAYEPLVRYQRGSGCGCCYMSRFTNRHCCYMCNLASKRTGKRSGGEMSLAEDVSSQQLSEVKRANPDCFCCRISYSLPCCSRCYE